MSSPLTNKALIRLTLVAAAAFMTSGCAYDYWQTTDRVAYSAGDAVHQNLERETTNPSSTNMNDVSGLGASGVVVPVDAPPTP